MVGMERGARRRAVQRGVVRARGAVARAGAHALLPRATRRVRGQM